VSCVRQDSHESSAAAGVLYNSILKQCVCVCVCVFAATFNKASQQVHFVSDNIIQLTDEDAGAFQKVDVAVNVK